MIRRNAFHLLWLLPAFGLLIGCQSDRPIDPEFQSRVYDGPPRYVKQYQVRSVEGPEEDDMYTPPSTASRMVEEDVDSSMGTVAPIDVPPEVPVLGPDEDILATRDDAAQTVKHEPPDLPPTAWTAQGDELPDPTEADDLTVVKDRRWIPVYFAYNQSFIGETERQKLQVLADYLQENDQYLVLVEGHCDERGSDEYNRALGQRRANEVHDYLAQLGVGTERIRTISYGEERPAAQGESEDAYRRNRRAEFVILLPE